MNNYRKQKFFMQNDKLAQSKSENAPVEAVDATPIAAPEVVEDAKPAPAPAPAPEPAKAPEPAAPALAPEPAKAPEPAAPAAPRKAIPTIF